MLDARAESAVVAAAAAAAARLQRAVCGVGSAGGAQPEPASSGTAPELRLQLELAPALAAAPDEPAAWPRGEGGGAGAASPGPCVASSHTLSDCAGALAALAAGIESVLAELGRLRDLPAVEQWRRALQHSGEPVPLGASGGEPSGFAAHAQDLARVAGVPAAADALAACARAAWAAAHTSDELRPLLHGGGVAALAAAFESELHAAGAARAADLAAAVHAEAARDWLRDLRRAPAAAAFGPLVFDCGAAVASLVPRAEALAG